MENYRTMIQRALLIMLLAMGSICISNAKDKVTESRCVKNMQDTVKLCLDGKYSWKKVEKRIKENIPTILN